MTDIEDGKAPSNKVEEPKDNFLQIIGSSTSRSKLNLGKYVPTIKKA